jgi:hypothetical protein
MSTALQIKVVTLLGYVALSTALVLMLADDQMQGAAHALFYAWFH